jgi:oligosaccharide repeat unit polymerase
MFSVLIVYIYATASASGVQFFTGYSTYNILVLGPLSTCAFMSAWFVNYFSINKIRFLFLGIYTLSSVLLLGLGSRMHFVLGFMALIIGLVAKNKRLLRSLPFYIAVTTCCLLVIAVGVAREGGREFSTENLMAVFFAESLFSSLSGAVYLENAGGRPPFGVPYDLFASLVNFVPSPIYPEKIELMAELTYSKHQGSPFGGRSLIANVYPNFGYFYPLYIGFIGTYYGYLYKRAHKSVFYRAVYFSALPILVFFFYREPIFTLMKVMFFNGLLVPIIVSLLLSYRIRKRRAASGGRVTLSSP